MFEKVKDIFKNIGMSCHEHSPEILITVGIVGSIATTIIACKATLKAEKIVDEHEGNMEVVERNFKKCGSGKGEEYSLAEYRKDKLIVTADTTRKFIVLYGPSLTLGIASIASIMCGYRILSKRNVALLAAYNLMEKSFTEYRSRVVSEYGKQKDDEFLHGVKAMEIEKKEKGKNGKTVTKTVKEMKINGNAISPYARWFTKRVPYEQFKEAVLTNKIYPKSTSVDDYMLYAGADCFSDAQYNRYFLTCQQANADRILHTKGFISLNQVYHMLGFEETEAGQIVGWSMTNPNGDHKVDFGINKYPDTVAYVPGSFLLDFNVDGSIIGNGKAPLAKI